MTDLTGACTLCGVHRQADKANCGEPDCPEQNAHGWEPLWPREPKRNPWLCEPPVDLAGDDPGPVAPGHVWVDLPGGGKTLRKLDG